MSRVSRRSMTASKVRNLLSVALRTSKYVTRSVLPVAYFSLRANKLAVIRLRCERLDLHECNGLVNHNHG